MNDIVLYFACKYFGDWERIFDALEEQQDIDFEELEILKEEHDGNYITVYDPMYPHELRVTSNPPFVLWYKGKLSLLANKNRYWVNGSYYDLETNEYLKHELVNFEKEGFTPISGFSSEFERGLIRQNSPKGMIIIRDAGIDSTINMSAIEEKTLMKDNLILSEYPNNVLPSLHTWKRSNSIKAWISKKVFIVNTDQKTSTFNMIAQIIDNHRDIYCYAGKEMQKSQNSRLISMGAYAINNIKELKN